MDSQAEKLNEDLVGVHQTDYDMERALNPMCWSWAEVEGFLQLNEPWSWIAIPCKGMSGLDIMSLEPAQVWKLCAPKFEKEKLAVFVDLVNYLRMLHWGSALGNKNEGGEAANSST